MAQKEQENLYLIVPSTEGAGPVTMEDHSVKDESLVGATKAAWRHITDGRKEVSADPAKVQNQIQCYVALLRDVAKKEDAKGGELRLSEITLSLTLSASGNIGIASTSAEAGITLVFSRG